MCNACLPAGRCNAGVTDYCVMGSKSGSFLKFLGTAGARFVMIRQLRASGGIWLSYEGTNVLIDPGPGSLVRCIESRPPLDPSKLDAVILTHRHLDHSADINVLIEAMTEGGFIKRGVVFCPRDAISADPVILRYARRLPERIEVLKSRSDYSVGKINFRTSMLHEHPVQTYGLRWVCNKQSIALLTDTKYFKRLRDFYRCDILIMSVVFLKSRIGVEHLSLEDARVIIRETQPKKVILTHFGMAMLKAGPSAIAKKLSQDYKTEVIAAYDGMMVRV